MPLTNGSGSGSITFIVDPVRIREAQKHVDPVDQDSDPQHCLREIVLLHTLIIIFFADFLISESFNDFLLILH